MPEYTIELIAVGCGDLFILFRIMKDATRGPIFACLYPGLCDIARRHGYALAIHGTLVGDMDLIAAPWTEQAVDAVTLKDALMSHIGACGYDALLERDSPWLTADQRRQVCEQQNIGLEGERTDKPHGRMAWNLYLWAGTKVDLSILPRMNKTVQRTAGNAGPEIMPHLRRL